PEGSLIRLLAGLLTLVSSGWPPSQSRNGSVVCLASPPRSQWRGRPGFSPGSLLSFKKTPEATTKSFYSQWTMKSSNRPISPRNFGACCCLAVPDPAQSASLCDQTHP